MSLLPYETNKSIKVVVFDINDDPVEFGGGGGGGDVNVLNFPDSYPLPDAQVLALTPPAAITGFATEAKQDDVITELQSIDGKDFATQTTLAAILAKLIAAPATEAKQDDIIVAIEGLSNPQSSNSSLSNVAASASSVTLLAANSDRKAATFYNDSDNVFYLKLGATASTSSFTIPIEVRGYYELPQPCYTGVIDGIWAGGAPIGNCRVTELT